MSISREALLGEWVHSHEEDEPGRTVFRRRDYPFPPARGRDAVELKADDTAIVSEPGPTDVPENETWKWTLEGETVHLDAGGKARSMEVIACDDERLIVLSR